MATNKEVTQVRRVRRVQIGSVMVDSGMVMIIDPCYIAHDTYADKHPELGKSNITVEYETAMDLCYNGSETFRKVGTTEDGKILVKPAGVFNPLDEMTTEKHRKIGYGAVCSTVQGDGTYPVYAVYEGNTLVGMEVRFQ